MMRLIVGAICAILTSATSAAQTWQYRESVDSFTDDTTRSVCAQTEAADTVCLQMNRWELFIGISPGGGAILAAGQYPLIRIGEAEPRDLNHMIDLLGRGLLFESWSPNVATWRLQTIEDPRHWRNPQGAMSQMWHADRLRVRMFVAGGGTRDVEFAMDGFREAISQLDPRVPADLGGEGEGAE